MIQKFLQNKKGFTLIELLVVVAIIGVLSGIVVTSLRGQTLKSRDGRRATDLDSIVLALQQYHNAQGTYPPNLAALVPTYLSKVPADPSTGAVYVYNSYLLANRPVNTAAQGPCTTATPCQGYEIGADLEESGSKLLQNDDGDSGVAPLNNTAGVTIRGADTGDCASGAVGKFCYNLISR